MPRDVESHNLVLRWAHILEQQVLRLRQSRQEAMETQKRWRATGVHEAADNNPFHLMDGDAHFAVLASAHLATALQRFDRNLRLPNGLKRTDLDDLRNALEHWDDEDGRAQRKMSTRGANPQSQRWSLTAQGLIGDIVADELPPPVGTAGLRRAGRLGSTLAMGERAAELTGLRSWRRSTT